MKEVNYQAIAELPEYQTLVRERKKLVCSLFLLTIIVYFSFILTIAFYPESLAKSLNDSVISIGLLAGLGVIAMTFIITGLYVSRANSTLEKLTDKVHQKLEEL